MKRTIACILTGVLSLGMCVSAMAGEEAAPAPETPESGVWELIAGEDGTTYVNLFEKILSDGYYQIWFDHCAAVTGEEAAADTVAFMQSSISSDLYGEEAIEAFADPEAVTAFDCWFINDAQEFTFQDDTATILKTDGSEETHTYEYLGQYEIGHDETMVYMGQEIPVGFMCDVYQSTDEAGEFNYFFFRDDTMDTTYHLEFRYGNDLEDLQGCFTGPYAYWLSAGFDKNADEETARDVIALFCLENCDYSAHASEALDQLAGEGFVGTWTADLSAYGDEYADTELYFTLDENGHGITTMNGEQTADFEAYAYDNGDPGDGKGIYVAYSNLEMEPNWADYIMETNEAGETVLNLYSNEGVITYVKSENTEESSAIEISTPEELQAINDNLSGNYILTADIDLI